MPELADTIIVAMHGFAGDQESSCIRLLEEQAMKRGVGLVRFDWPAHGVSPAEDSQLRVEHCLSDLDTVVGWVRKQWPKARLFAFATSFGGYLALLYHHRNRGVFDQLLLRSPAIRMYDVMMDHILDDAAKDELMRKDTITVGFERKIELPEPFLHDLRQNDAFHIWDGERLEEVAIIHGTADDVVPVEDSVAFAQAHRCALHLAPGTDHRYKKPGELEQVLQIAADLLDVR